MLHVCSFDSWCISWCMFQLFVLFMRIDSVVLTIVLSLKLSNVFAVTYRDVFWCIHRFCFLIFEVFFYLRKIVSFRLLLYAMLRWFDDDLLKWCRFHLFLKYYDWILFCFLCNCIIYWVRLLEHFLCLKCNEFWIYIVSTVEIIEFVVD